MKLNNFLRKPIILVAGSMLMLNSCKKSFIEVPVEGATEEEQFWQTPDDARKGVSAIYANLRSWPQVAFAAISIESLGSDDSEKGSSTNDASFLNDFDNFSVGPSSANSSGQIHDFWKGQYLEIQYCNQVLDNVPGITMDETLKNRYLAEAKFIRAFCYFRLVRAFGDVPLRLKTVDPDNTAEFNIPRTPKEQVWAAIESDLNDAAAVLPQAYGAEDLGRVTKGAALSLHAKVAMYQGHWADVLSYTNQVMGMGYSLFSDFEKQFRVPNENNSESVFEIQCQYIPGNCDASSSQYSQIQGVRGSTGGGWGFHVPTEELANSFETDDPRKDATIIFRGETTPQGDAIPASGDNPRYNQKTYVPFANYPGSCNEGADQNIRVIRYAEVLLMNAEAANEQNNTTLALSSLNAVRDRARGANPLTVLPPVTTTDKNQLRDAIWRERRSELAMEYDRYFDVIRQGRGQAIFGPKGWLPGKNEVWPIPQAEIDISGGLLTQNPGY
jgi:hypothetical protein